MFATMDNLKPIVSRYLEVNKKLSEINARAKDLREQRQSVELDLAAAYAHTRELPNKIELKSSQMVLTVKAPGESKKGWTLSKKQLETYLNDILPEHGPDVYAEILRRHEPTLVVQDYVFDLKSTE